jgi:hypothetical protein
MTFSVQRSKFKDRIASALDDAVRSRNLPKAAQL